MPDPIDNILPHLPVADILAAYAAAPGDEMGSGKFASPESSAALAANAFGLFLSDARRLPAFSVWPDIGPFDSLRLEAEMRFPWAGGRHPWLDAAACSATHMIGIESKRFEPFRGGKKGRFAAAYWRDVWKNDMNGFQSMRDRLTSGALGFRHLDAVQLVKHGLGLLTQSGRRRPLLLYVYAEPSAFADGRAIDKAAHRAHRQEIEAFAAAVRGDAVRFAALSYDALLSDWAARDDLRSHAEAVRRHFLI